MTILYRNTIDRTAVLRLGTVSSRGLDGAAGLDEERARADKAEDELRRRRAEIEDLRVRAESAERVSARSQETRRSERSKLEDLTRRHSIEQEALEQQVADLTRRVEESDKAARSHAALRNRQHDLTEEITKLRRENDQLKKDAEVVEVLRVSAARAGSG